jgi:hypothetical protein
MSSKVVLSAGTGFNYLEYVVVGVSNDPNLAKVVQMARMVRVASKCKLQYDYKQVQMFVFSDHRQDETIFSKFHGYFKNSR